MPWVFKIKNNTLPVDLIDNISEYINTMKDGEFILEYPQEVKESESKKQKKYQWSVLYKQIEKEIGVFTRDEWHQLLQKKFSSYEKEGAEFILSTNKMTAPEREEYFQKVRGYIKNKYNIELEAPCHT